MNERENEGYESSPPIFGLLLPSGVGEGGRHVDIWMLFDMAMQRFLDVETVFKEHFGFSDETLALRDETSVFVGEPKP